MLASNGTTKRRNPLWTRRPRVVTETCSSRDALRTLYPRPDPLGGHSQRRGYYQVACPNLQMRHLTNQRCPPRENMETVVSLDRTRFHSCQHKPDRNRSDNILASSRPSATELPSISTIETGDGGRAVKLDRGTSGVATASEVTKLVVVTGRTLRWRRRACTVQEQ